MLRATLALLAAALLLAGCSGSTSSAPAKTVQVKDNNFNPTTVNISAGQTVAWSSEGQNKHTVSIHAGNEHPFDETLEPGKSVQYTFKEKGTYEVHCNFHASMQMTVNVA